jgi:hypothetical protein
MIDPGEFRAPFIHIDEIRKTADDFRARYWPQDTIPIDIFEILEFDLDLQIRTISNLKEAGDVDALLLGDLKTIVVDQDDFLNERAQNRLRFSLAHEIGHLVLHSDIFTKIEYASVDAWINFFQNIPDDQYTWIEQHAYEFAGRLLVPLDKLKDKLNDAIEMAENAGFDSWDRSGDSTRGFISHAISRFFGVSQQVIEKRLMRENLWPSERKS